jgi:transposase
LNNESPEGVVHMHINTIGVDLAKNVFQVHGADSAGKVVIHPSVAAQAGPGLF